MLVGTSTRWRDDAENQSAGLVEEMTACAFRNNASAFSSHGWSGGAAWIDCPRAFTELPVLKCPGAKRNGVRIWMRWSCAVQHGRDIARRGRARSRCRKPAENRAGEETTTCAAADYSAQNAMRRMPSGYDPAALGEPLQDVAPEFSMERRLLADSFLCPECSLGKDVFDVLATGKNSRGSSLLGRAAPARFSLSKISVNKDAHVPLTLICCGQHGWYKQARSQPRYQPVAARR